MASPELNQTKEQRFLEMLSARPDTLDSRQRFLGMLKDFFPKERAMVNLLSFLYDIRIHSELAKAERVTRDFAYRFTRQLVDEYEVNQQYAESIVALFCVCYGEKMLGKPCDLRRADDSEADGNNKKEAIYETGSAMADLGKAKEKDDAARPLQLKPEAKTEQTTKTETLGQKNAVRDAHESLGFRCQPYSREGMIRQLKRDGFTNEEAIYGADNVGADWMDASKMYAKMALDCQPHSREDLIKILKRHGYTDEEAVYGADSALVDQKFYGDDYRAVQFSQPKVNENIAQRDDETEAQSNAVKMAKEYLIDYPCSRKGLIWELEYKGFTKDEAIYGADNAGADWYEQAIISAEEALDSGAYSRRGLIRSLEQDGFTIEEAIHGVNATGL